MSPAFTRRRILVVEDDPAVRHLIDIVLTCRGHDVLLARSVAIANSRLLDFPGEPAVALLDVMLPDGMDGHTYGLELRSRFPDIRLVFMTGWPDRPETMSATALGPILFKPFRMEDLSAAVDAG